MIYHLKELEPRGGPVRNYILRCFTGKNLRREPLSGQPWKKYCGMCVLTVRDRVCEVQAIESVRYAMRCLAVLRGPVAVDLDLVDMWGERWDPKTETIRIVRIPLLWSATSDPLPDRAEPLRFSPARQAPSSGRSSAQRGAGTYRRSKQRPAGVG